MTPDELMRMAHLQDDVERLTRELADTREAAEETVRVAILEHTLEAVRSSEKYQQRRADELESVWYQCRADKERMELELADALARADAQDELTAAINRLAATRTKDEAVQHAIDTTAALLRLWVAEHFADIKQRNRTLEAVLTAARAFCANDLDFATRSRMLWALEDAVRAADALPLTTQRAEGHGDASNRPTEPGRP